MLLVYITDYLKSGENVLVVGAYDPNDGRAASGKNGSRGDYIFTSGIWQTVWLEPVEKQYISQIKLVPDLKNNQLEVIAYTEDKELKVTAIADNGTSEVARTEGNSNMSFYLPIREPRLWSPDDPFLYGLKLQLKDRKGEIIDEVSSYFGMRSVSMGKVDGVLRPLLNGEFVFHIGLLDQGYWPDGAFTAPTDKALLYDIELAKRAGFNVIRKHIKVEPQRCYYHCDRLGLMVWQDMPNLWEPDGEDSVAVRKQFRDELKVMIDQHVSSPSIVMWVPFNENWGAFEATDITAWVKKYDPNRWVNGMSGYNYAPGYRKAYGDPGNGDFVDMHHYGKIEPKAIGVGQYQHDMPQKRLNETLDGVVEDCVNSVGVDLNTASAPLLRRVAGVSAATAKNIVAWREEEGAFTSRAQLKKVKGLGPKAYEQCAGFLRLPEAKNRLDATAVHPESYPAAKALLDACGYTTAEIGSDKLAGLPAAVKAKGTKNLCEMLGIGEPTLNDIVAELCKPGRDVRDSLPKPLLRSDVMSLEDLKPGMELTGTVRNVIDFGAFVDLGVHQDGLVHVSQISDKFIKHPSEVLKVGDIVRVKVLSVDTAKKRIALTMKGLH